jgi:hypothetical protein
MMKSFGFVTLLAACTVAKPIPIPAVNGSVTSDEHLSVLLASIQSPQQWQNTFHTAVADTPSGYQAVFANMKAIVTGTPLTNLTLKTYDPQECADTCDKTEVCNPNIYYTITSS